MGTGILRVGTAGRLEVRPYRGIIPLVLKLALFHCKESDAGAEIRLETARVHFKHLPVEVCGLADAATLKKGVSPGKGVGCGKGGFLDRGRLFNMGRPGAWGASGKQDG